MTTSRTSSGLRMLPGLRRSPWMPASSAFSASVCSKWMSAISGTGEWGTISGSAAAALRSGTATRTISHPASASSRICRSVAAGIARVGGRHRLDDDRVVAADLDVADVEDAGRAAWGDQSDIGSETPECSVQCGRSRCRFETAVVPMTEHVRSEWHW